MLARSFVEECSGKATEVSDEHSLLTKRKTCLVS